MPREDMSQLYSALTENRFSFVPIGLHSLQEVYAYVQERYPELCDDSYLCSANCSNGHNNPEWQHRVRAAIWVVKDLKGYVARDGKRGFWIFGDPPETNQLPQEADASSFSEGHAVQVTVNRYERSAGARSACIAHHGYSCSVCEHDMSEIYGDVAAALIHVHHINPLALQEANSVVDPVQDLRPVCPNCHAVIHLKTPPFTIDEVKQMLAGIN